LGRSREDRRSRENAEQGREKELFGEGGAPATSEPEQPPQLSGVCRRRKGRRGREDREQGKEEVSREGAVSAEPEQGGFRKRREDRRSRVW
jgi:hypothetical protein